MSDHGESSRRTHPINHITPSAECERIARALAEEDLSECRARDFFLPLPNELPAGEGLSPRVLHSG